MHDLSPLELPCPTLDLFIRYKFSFIRYWFYSKVKRLWNSLLPGWGPQQVHFARVLFVFFFLFFFFNLFYLFIFLASGVVCIVSVFPRRDMVQEYIKYRHLPNHAIFMYQSCQREPKNFTFTFFFLFFFFSYFIAIQF